MTVGRELGSLATHRAYLKLPPKDGPVTPFPMAASRVFAIQVRGLVRRLKAIRCKCCVLGLSGGLDSALALLVTHAAFDRLGLDKSGIRVLTMPGFGTTRRTKGNAGILCEGLGLELETVDITKACRQHFRDIGHDGKTPDVTYENAQARMRTMILMDKANMTGGIVVGTGDLSEIALGWSTYNGDHMSMFAVNSGVPKTVVRKVCAWYAHRAGCPQKVTAALDDIIATPVSPELVKGQVTEDKIGPYELHDFFLWNFIVNEMGSKDLQRAAERYFLGGQRVEVGGQRSEGGGQRVEVRGQRSEVRGQRSEVGGQRSEVRGLRSEVRGLRSEEGSFRCLTFDLQPSAFNLQPSTFSRELIAKTLKTFMNRFFTQAFKRNCQPDGVRVFPFELSLRGWWIPSDLGCVKL